MSPKYRKAVFCYTGILLALAGCSQDDDEEPAAPGKPPAYMLYSPNGEPLNGGPLGKPTCKEALGRWFERMSAGGSGRISAGAFMEDARHQFAKMDIDHNGYIASEELDRFREPYRQHPPAQTEEPEDKSQKGHEKHKEGRGSHSDPSLSMSDPVMSADTNLDFKVTPEEFTRQAQDTFAKLDTNHDGTLDRSEVLTLCQPPKQP
jgi:hypothetical protein